MRKLSLVVMIGLLLPGALLAQAPAAGSAAPATNPATATNASGGIGAGRVAVVDLQRAITENADGKKAQEKFMAEFNKKQQEFDAKQKALNEAQTKLQSGDKAMSDAAKAELAKSIDKMNTELQRMNDDAQKELPDLQQTLFKPIAEKTQEVLKAYSTENGFAVVFDVSSQASSIVYVQDVADITTEIIRRVDAAPPKPAAAAPTKPAANPAALPAAPKK
jgi:Skp family chaperone for outer membrane proteins